MKKAVAEGLVADGTWAGVDRVRTRRAVLSEVRQVPSLEEVFRLADQIALTGPRVSDGGARGERLRAAVLLCGTSGLRPGEATGLLTRDVHLGVVHGLWVPTTPAMQVSRLWPFRLLPPVSAPTGAVPGTS